MWRNAAYTIVMCLLTAGCYDVPSCSSDKTLELIKNLIERELIRTSSVVPYEKAKSSIEINDIHTISTNDNGAKCQAKMDIHHVVSQEHGISHKLTPQTADYHTFHDVVFNVTRTDDGQLDYVTIKSATRTGME
jgi:hypothetical protein